MLTKYTLLLPFSLFLSIVLSGQNKDEIKFGILPTEYAEGMPPEEFLELEEQIIEEIRKIPRFKIVKTQEDYYEAELGADWVAQLEAIRKQGIQSNVPYLLQIVFGDTEWIANREEVETAKAVVKDGKEVTPRTVKKYWTHSASLYVTLNLYKVETGELEKSLTFTSSSSNDFNYKKAKIKRRQDHKFAVSAAKPLLLAAIKAKLKKLAPLKLELLKPVEQTAKAVKSVQINAGIYHGLQEGDRFYVFYEVEHLVNGKPVIREVEAGTLVVEKLNSITAVCKVKKGGKDLKNLLAEGKALKCGFKNYNDYSLGF